MLISQLVIPVRAVRHSISTKDASATVRVDLLEPMPRDRRGHSGALLAASEP